MGVVLPNVFGTAVSPVGAGELDQNFNVLANAINNFFPISNFETRAGVTPINLNLQPGDFRRYGADPTGATPSDAAINQAISCNTDVFDSYPGGGVYLLNNPLTFSGQPIRIRGQGIRYSPANTTGTTLLLSAAAGSNVGALQVPNALYGFEIDGITVQVQNATIGQVGLFCQNELRAARIKNFAVITSDQTSANNTTAIQFNGGTVFTGDVLIQGMFCTNVNRGINLAGSCTTVKIRDCEMYGNGAGVNGIGILAGPQVQGCSVIGCTIEAFSGPGIQFSGKYIIQVANHYEQAAQPPFIWLRGAGNPRIWAQSFGEMFIGTTAPPQFPQNNVDLCQVLSGPGTYYLDNAGIQMGLGIGLNLQPIQLQNTGFGTPTGNSIIANFPGATATLAQTSATVAEILAILKQRGDIGN